MRDDILNTKLISLNFGAISLKKSQNSVNHVRHSKQFI